MAVPLKLRGWMIDAARLPETLAYYRRTVDMCAEWGYNAILLRLTDDQGSAFRFRKHPQLLTHEKAFSAEELRPFLDYAESRGIMIIPEVESFGHATYVAQSPAYAHLRDCMPDGSPGMTGLIPVHPETLALMADLYREVAEAFPSPYLHGGCDEVNWGGSEMSRKALKGRNRASVWAEYLNSLNKLARGLGKEFIVWGDHVLRNEPAILDDLSKDIIIHDWAYGDEDPNPIQARMEKALAKGFRIIGGPACGWCSWGARVGTRQLVNIASYADVYRASENPNCLGVLVTHWVPGRFLPSGMWDDLAFAGVALNEGASVARREAFKRFVEKHYLAEWSDLWDDIFRSVHDLTPMRIFCSVRWLGQMQSPLWIEQKSLSDAMRQGFDHVPWGRLRAQIKEASVQVRGNAEDFSAFALSVEIMDHIQWRTKILLEAVRSEAKPAELAAIFGKISARDREIAVALEGEHSRWRFSGCPHKKGFFNSLHADDQLILAFNTGADYAASLAANPALAAEAVKQA